MPAPLVDSNLKPLRSGSNAPLVVPDGSTADDCSCCDACSRDAQYEVTITGMSACNVCLDYSGKSSRSDSISGVNATFGPLEFVRQGGTGENAECVYSLGQIASPNCFEWTGYDDTTCDTLAHTSSGYDSFQIYIHTHLGSGNIIFLAMEMIKDTGVSGGIPGHLDDEGGEVRAFFWNNSTGVALPASSLSNELACDLTSNVFAGDYRAPLPSNDGEASVSLI